MNFSNKKPELTIILPCRNEEQALDFCLKQIKQTIKKNKLNAEIIVSDSSEDSSPEIAKQHKIKLIKHNKQGYGIAYLEAFKHVKGKYIFMADADNTYDFSEIPRFIKPLREGFDFVIGNRFGGKIENKAMSSLHRYIGNPLLSSLLRLFHKTKITDVHCGMKAVRKDSLEKLKLKATGMEFASEFVIKAAKNKLKTKELSINYYKRKGSSKLRSFSDGWRHLRFMLLYSPLFLFFIPGVLLSIIGIGTMAWSYFGSPQIFGLKLSFHPMFVSSTLIIVSYQLIIFALFAKSYAVIHLEDESSFLEKIYKHLTIEKAGTIGVAITIIGLAIFSIILIKWFSSGFGALNEIKNSIVALTLSAVGIQTIFSSFMLSILEIKEK